MTLHRPMFPEPKPGRKPDQRLATTLRLIGNRTRFIPLPDSCTLAEYAAATPAQQADYISRVRDAWSRWDAEDARRRFTDELDADRRDLDEDERGEFR